MHNSRARVRDPSSESLERIMLPTIYLEHPIVNWKVDRIATLPLKCILFCRACVLQFLGIVSCKVSLDMFYTSYIVSFTSKGRKIYSSN